MLLSILGIVVLSLFIVFCILYLSLPSLPSQIPFDSQKWKSAISEKNNTRYRMHKDLIKNYKLIGKTKDEIFELLGSQNETLHLQDWDLCYWMGPEPSLISIDSIWLVMKLKNNKVVKYKLITD